MLYIFTVIAIAVFVGTWVQVAKYARTKGGQSNTAVVRHGGGFVAGLIAVTLLGVVFGSLFGSEHAETAAAAGSGSASISQTQSAAARAPTPASSHEPSIVGTWWCRNDENYIHKQVYGSDGSLREYESGIAPGVRAEGLRLEYRGTYKFDGQIVRYTLLTPSDTEMSGAVKVAELTEASLVLYYQDMNTYENCFKPIE